MKENIVVATIKEWNIANYFQLKEEYSNKFSFHLITQKEELTKELIKKLNPKFIFFPHWSWIISKDIYSQYDCVVFHMTDLPYGRGGSPLQNLIVREVYNTKISALKVDDGIDTGAIYLKEDFDISLGSAEEIFIKLSEVIFEKMIPKFLNEDLVPKEQEGEIFEFKRRKKEESDLQTLQNTTLKKVYDFIRMLDAEGYPKAFIKINNLNIEFSEVHMKNNKLVGRFEVLKDE